MKKWIKVRNTYLKSVLKSKESRKKKQGAQNLTFMHNNCSSLVKFLGKERRKINETK